MDGPRDYHTEWSKSEREKQMCINAYLWNLEKWYRWTYLQGRNRDVDIENSLSFHYVRLVMEVNTLPEEEGRWFVKSCFPQDTAPGDISGIQRQSWWKGDCDLMMREGNG